MGIKDILSILPSVGDGLSRATRWVIQFIAKYGVNLTALQSKLLLILVFGISIYIIFSVVTIAKKLLKWGLLALLVFLIISVIISVFA